MAKPIIDTTGSTVSEESRPISRACRVGLSRWLAGAALLSLGFVLARYAPLPRDSELRCETHSDCRSLLLAARQATARCLLDCGGRERDLAVAKALYRQVMEQEAADEYERLERERELRKRSQTAEQARRARAARREQLRATEQAHRRELELIEARAEQERRSLRDQRQQRIAYFQNLSLGQKLTRLQGCIEAEPQLSTAEPTVSAGTESPTSTTISVKPSLNPCDELVAQLVAACERPDQKRALVTAYENSTTTRSVEAVEVSFSGPSLSRPGRTSELAKTAPTITGVQTSESQQVGSQEARWSRLASGSEFPEG